MEEKVKSGKEVLEDFFNDLPNTLAPVFSTAGLVPTIRQSLTAFLLYNIKINFIKV